MNDRGMATSDQNEQFRCDLAWVRYETFRLGSRPVWREVAVTGITSGGVLVVLYVLWRFVA